MLMIVILVLAFHVYFVTRYQLVRFHKCETWHVFFFYDWLKLCSLTMALIVLCCMQDEWQQHARTFFTELFLCNFLWKDMPLKQLGTTPVSTNKGKMLLCNMWQPFWQHRLTHRPHISVCQPQFRDCSLYWRPHLPAVWWWGSQI